MHHLHGKREPDYYYKSENTNTVFTAVPPKAVLRWLKTVSSTNICMGYCNHSLSLDATIMVSKHSPIIGEQIIVIFIAKTAR